MTATIHQLPTALYHAERLENARNEVAFCAMKVRQAQTVLDQYTGELELAREELAALEAPLQPCGTCKTHHQVPLSPCPEPGPCATCGYHPHLPGCFDRGSDE